MKKLYALFLALAAAMTANAANFELTVHGTPVKDGDRIDITSYLEPFGAGYQYNPEIMLNPSVNGEASVLVEFTKGEVDPPLDSDWLYGAELKVSVCSFGDCTMKPVGQSVTKTGTVTAGTPVPMAVELIVFLGDEQKMEELKVNAEFTFQCTLGGETSKVTLYVDNQSGNVAGINSDTVKAEYFDLQGRSVQMPQKGIYVVRRGYDVRKVIF